MMVTTITIVKYAAESKWKSAEKLKMTLKIYVSLKSLKRNSAPQ
jgi:hypothetical protein